MSRLNTVKEAATVRNVYMARQAYIAKVESELLEKGISDPVVRRLMIIEEMINSEYSDTIAMSDVIDYRVWKKQNGKVPA